MTHYILDARAATPHFPGIGRYLRNLAPALAPLLTADENLTLLESPDGLLADGRGPDSATRAVPVSVSPFDISQQWRIPLQLRRLRASGPALYHSPYFLMPYRPGLPTLLTFYDIIPLTQPQSVPPKARLFFRLGMTLALRAASHLLAISHAARDDLLRYFSIPASKVSVTPLAVDPRFRPQAAAEIARVRAKYSLPPRYILYFGINKPHKNLPALVDAYAQMSTPATPPLLIAGAWDERYPQPKQRARHHRLGDKARFLGPVDDADLPALYNAATLFVFPSLHEGFGLPVLEAMACGAPVACANSASLPEIAGDAGRLFDPYSVEEIRKAISELLEDSQLRAHLRRRGLARARRFSWQATAAATLRCYRNLLD